MKIYSQAKPDDPQGWTYWASIHGVTSPPPAELEAIYDQCDHTYQGHIAQHVLSWHRAYLLGEVKNVINWLDAAERKIAVWQTIFLILGAQALSKGASRWLANPRRPRWVIRGLYRSSEMLGRWARRVYQVEIRRRRPIPNDQQRL